MKLAWVSLALAVAILALEKPVQAQTTQQPETTTPNATYWLTMNKKLRPGFPIQLTTMIFPGNDPVTITLTITYQSYERPETTMNLMISSPKVVAPGATRVVEFDIPMDIKVKNSPYYGEYMVNIVGQGRTLNFTHKETLNFVENTFSIFIALDKAMYKPGQTVNFRALAMNPANTKVFKQPMDIIITDPKGNRIKQLIGVSGSQNLGVVQDKLELSASTPLGDWEISATVMGQTEKKTFPVKNYVLPRYEVQVTVPSIPVVTDRAHTITISAKYTFGQPVINGRANVRITVYQFWNHIVVEQDILRSGRLNSNGEFVFEVNKKQLLDLLKRTYEWTTDLSGWSFNVDANVTEDATNRVQSGSAIMQMFQSITQTAVHPTTASNFKSGLPYTAYLEVKKSDGSQLPQEVLRKMKVHINVTYEVLATNSSQGNGSQGNGSQDKMTVDDKVGLWYSRYRTESKILHIDNPVQTVSDSGFVAVSFNVPNETWSINIEAIFDQGSENHTLYHYVARSMSPSGSFIKIITPLKRPTVGETIPVKVISTELVKQLTCQVFSKGILVWNSTISSPTVEGSKTIDFALPISHVMAPNLHILVFYIRQENSEVVADAQSIGVNGLFQKKVSMSFSKKKVEPGENFEAIINAETGSIVFLVARDKSSEIAKNGSDITEETVRASVSQFDGQYFYPRMNSMFRCGWPMSYSGEDSARIIQSADVLFFTNGFLFHFRDPNPVQFMAEDGVKFDFSSKNSFGRPGVSEKMLAPAKTRKFFPENWLWNIHHIGNNSNGVIRVPVTSPDQITTWVARLFSVHPEYGLSVGSASAEVTTFRNLFVSLDVPAFIVRNEVFCLTSSVFSYYTETISVLLKFENSDDFNGMFVNRSGQEAVMSFENKAHADFYPEVAMNDVKTSRFCFTPIKTGEITVKVSALTNVPGLSDAVEQVILVKAEGVPRSNNYPSLVNLTSGFWQKQVPLSFPADTVSDSQSIVVSVAGNVIGSIFNNIKDFLKKPYGCGEQNMINFAPSISVLDFFFSTNTITPEILKEAKDNINSGYQTELTYEHSKSGGFSAFGDNDANSSTWLTAFVLSTLCKAANADRKHDMSLGLYMTDVIIRSAQYLMSNQNSDGSISEYGVVFHVDMQGGSAQDDALTAYTLIALFEAAETLKDNATALTEIQTSMSRAGDFLARRFNDINEPYSVSIVTYALHKINHASKASFFTKMEQKATTGDGVKFWQQTLPVKDSSYQWSPSDNSLNIEATAYALLTYSIRGSDITDGIPILRYLTQKFGPNGGFISTQDTVIGIQALSGVLAKMYSAGDYSMTFTISYVDDKQVSQSQIVHLSKGTEFLMQTINIPHKNNAPNNLLITANTNSGESGPSTVLVDTVLYYNVKGEAIPKCYSLSHDLTRTKVGLDLTIHLKSLSENATSMSILSVEVPTGYAPDVEAVTASRYVSRVDAFNGDTLYIYFNSYVIDNNGISVSIPMFAANGALVTSQPKSYSAYDYYKPDCIQTKTYTLSSQPVCEVVPGEGICSFL